MPSKEEVLSFIQSEEYEPIKKARKNYRTIDKTGICSKRPKK